MRNKYAQCCEHFGRDDKRYEKCKSKPNFKPLGVGPKIKAYRKCKKNLDSGLDSDSDISVDNQNTTTNTMKMNMNNVANTLEETTNDMRNAKVNPTLNH